MKKSDVLFQLWIDDIFLEALSFLLKKKKLRSHYQESQNTLRGISFLSLSQVCHRWVLQ